jgi:hypothetical protein
LRGSHGEESEKGREENREEGQKGQEEIVGVVAALPGWSAASPGILLIRIKKMAQP